MKRIVAVVSALVLLFGMVSCGGGNEAFEVSKSAYEKVNKAYEMVNMYSEDIYQAWYMGINDEYDINDDYELDNFAEKLHIEEKDLQNAIGKLLGNDSYKVDGRYAYHYHSGSDWSDLHIDHYRDFFSACVDVVSEAYKVNGTVDEIEALLEESKALMKQLSNDYSDYEHYPNLKEYFTTTSAFFGFCQEPEGSFEQVVETFNDYRNDARDYYYDLNYVFEDSIFEKYQDAENTEDGGSEDEADAKNNGVDTTATT